jgi:ech hydrogenase subunit E
MKRTVVPMGPQHPVLVEPVVLDLVLEDETVVDAIPKIGYIHRGLEAMVERVEFADFGAVAERICGICSFMHGMGYAQGVEALMKIEVPERAVLLRLFWAELSRIQSHLLWLGLGADALGFENLFMQCWKHREAVLDIFAHTTGGRLIHSVNRPGGVKRDITADELAGFVRTLEQLGRAFTEVREVVLTDPSIRHRLGGLGVLTAQAARESGVVGPMARASGLAEDVRCTVGAGYDRLKFTPVTETEGDCLARCKVRVREVEQSLELIHQVVELLGQQAGPIENKVKGFPNGEAYVRLEQPRGEVVYYLKANGTRFLERYRARTPTFANLPAMLKLIKGCTLSDVANIILTIDPCISCAER